MKFLALSIIIKQYEVNFKSGRKKISEVRRDKQTKGGKTNSKERHKISTMHTTTYFFALSKIIIIGVCCAIFSKSINLSSQKAKRGGWKK